MSRLVRVELRRLVARRAVVLGVLAALAGVAVALVGAWNYARPLTAAEQELAEQQWQLQVEDWEENGERYIADCREQEEAESEATGEDVDFGCDSITAPEREWFFPQPATFEEFTANALGSSGLLVVALALFVGATFTAAEFATGSMGNWLTFEPRRGRVYASKLIAVSLAAVVVSALLVALQVGGTAFAYAQNGLDVAFTADLAWTAVRLAALGALSAVVGASLGVLLRHTAAVLGVVAAYAIVDGMTSGTVAWLQPWKVLLNLQSWILDGASYWVQECTVSETGTMCEGIERTVSLGHSAAYLLGATALIALVGVLVFRRRDVS
ncbi:hypothetical protein Bcav_2894 [Beutenbergia cavernae DSM 12333]|uniref:Uncharacterized protein n=1 Tax=Beutenbergia cavernae (strain ATCC BAA-8 / DSM 12333 / CCUG 43141 / JCM 11478 / NBRC 16432 / NCIMB 13614 / HKI 0122) TaxID=471853 RepID=C5BZ24_BEUC1|nr:ABC transporter permease [Beutenbergia cavernae]ACQ81139.1 hypothetical protein Bcav_2894 [Beutenbergia cavernae DSM 12333]